MISWLRTHVWHLGLGALALALLVGGLVAGRYRTSDAEPAIPEEYQALWNWVRDLRQGKSPDAVEEGFQLLSRYPQLRTLYLRLSELCLEVDLRDQCRGRMGRVPAVDSLASLYRQAALARLSASESAASTRWLGIAGSAVLDLGLARMIVDEGLAAEDGSWLEEIETRWKEQLAVDSTLTGAGFGLGYLHVRRSEWEPAEKLLLRVTRMLPGDPHAYRELGRIYLITGKPDRFEEVLETGIRVAAERHDLEQELILRGNLGWWLATRNVDLDRAEATIREALRQSRLLADEATTGFNQFRLADILLKKFQYDDVLTLLDSAEVRFRTHAPHQLAAVYRLRGEAFSSLYRFREAEKAFETAITEAEERNNVGSKAIAFSSLTQLYYRMGRYGAAREAGLQALALARQHDMPDVEVHAHILLGDVEQFVGAVEKAIAHFQSGLRLARENGNVARVRELRSRLGRVYLSVGDVQAAEKQFEQLLALLRTEHAAPRYLAGAYGGLGHIYHDYENYEEAIRYYDLALEQLEGSNDRRARSDLLVTKALTLLRLHRLEEAEALLFEARTMDFPSMELDIAIGLGTLALYRGDFERAVSHFEWAERIERKSQYPLTLWYVLFAKALAHWSLGQRDRAEHEFVASIELIEALREHLGSSKRRALFVQDRVQVYEYFAAFLEEQGRSSEALSIAERARSRSLLDLLYATRQAGEPGSHQTAGRMIELD